MAATNQAWWAPIQASWHGAVFVNAVNPKDLKQAVSLALPAKMSNAKTWLICCPCNDQPLVKLSSLHRWSWSEWGLKHTGSAHKWMPLAQLSPALALAQPLGKLNALQRHCFWGVSNALLIRAAGMLGPRFLPLDPLVRPFLCLLAACEGFSTISLGLMPCFSETLLWVAPDNGSKWNATVGWLRMVGSARSMGNWFAAFLFMEVILSDRNRKAARKICWTDTAEYPGGGGVCRWSSKSAW